MSENVKRMLADYLEQKAAWRTAKAVEYPGDIRNVRGAQALRTFAAYVRTLPTDDERLRDLAECYCTGDGPADAFLPAPGGEVAGAIGRFGFNEAQDCEAFLRWMVKSGPREKEAFGRPTIDPDAD
jgi:hypothetical protein